MDRRSREIPPEDRFRGGAGQSYRPGNVQNRSPPPRRDRDDGFYGRSPPRRPFNRGGPQRSRSPLGREPFRRRSPSPRDRFGGPRGDSYRARSRTPPRRDGDPFRRGELDRRDSREDRDFRDGRRFGDDRRSPARGARDRSPFNGDRSPVSARGRRTPRRFSPSQRRFDDRPPSRPRSPPRKGFSPRDRPRSPLSRHDIASLPDRSADTWRRQSPPAAGDDRGRDSIATSRRSSPPLHASRLALIQDQDGQRSGRPSPRSNHGDQTRLPPTRRPDSPSRDRDGDTFMQDSGPRPSEQKPPSGPRDSRAPPSGPRAASSSVIPPAGPSRGGFASRGRGAYSVDFTGRGRGATPSTYQPDRSVSATFAQSTSFEREPSSSIPQGPRNQPPRPSINRAPSSMTLSSRYDAVVESPRDARPPTNFYRRPTEPGIVPSGPAGDRTRRFDNGIHPALRDLPEAVTNGRKLPPPVDQTRLNKLEDESERLRKAVHEREAKKRKSLREWDRLVRETESAAFRSEVAEESVRAYELEAESAGLAF